MSTFKISEPIIEENGNTSIENMMNDFSSLVAECGYKLGYANKNGNSDTNYTIEIEADGKSYPIEMIVGKKYIRLMNKRLNPTITSQVTYEKDLKIDKYKANVISLVSSLQELDKQNDRLIALVAEMSKLETEQDFDYYESKYDIDEISRTSKNDVVLIKKLDGSGEISIILDNSSNKFKFRVNYPEKEFFNLLDNFLPETDFEPKMNGINNRIAEYNAIAGEIIQKVISDGKNENSEGTREQTGG